MYDNVSETLHERLTLILEAIGLIEERMKSISEADDFIATPTGIMIMDSVALRLQTIGENVKKIERLQPELLEKFPQVNWNRIIRFRDMISHHYENAHYEVMYDICNQHLEPLRQTVLLMMENIK